jgi:hypothetical protein
MCDVISEIFGFFDVTRDEYASIRREAAALDAMQVDPPENYTLMGGYMSQANEAPLVSKRKTLFICWGSSGLFPPNIWSTWPKTFSKPPQLIAYLNPRESYPRES